MTYVMSDLHGQYEKYLKMLEKISFSEEDDLYIVGDVVDRGPQPVELLRDMSLRINVFPIMGNHDMTAALLLRKLCTEITEDNCENQIDGELLKVIAMWQNDGGQTTLEGFRKLAPEDREALIEYMEDFAPYEIVTVGGRKFILVHGGIPYSKRSLPMKEQSVHELVTERPDYSKRYYKNVYMVTGHTPTVTIGKQYAGHIYRENGHIAIDCGAGFDLSLGCIRLDDFYEFYV
ncbi:MAG: metallophosphoesterase [Clostridia bacterium]|nr:metallophosphoesterase [Clostridia bacterium]